MSTGKEVGKTFTFTFTGNSAEYMAERFSAYYWDGGLDETIEQDFLNEFGLSLDDTEFDENGVIIKTSKISISEGG